MGGWSTRWSSWAAVGERRRSLRSFLNRPLHTTPTPSAEEEGEEPVEEEHVNNSGGGEADVLVYELQT